MIKELFNSPKSLFYAVLVHLLLFALLLVSFDWTPKPKAGAPNVKAMQAVVVDESRIQEEIRKIRSEEKQREQEQKARLEQMEKQAREAQRRRQKEEKRLADLKKQRAAEQRKRRAEKERMAKLKTQQEALAKKRSVEQQRLAALEAKRKIEAEKLHKAEAARLREEAARKQREAELKTQLEAEERGAREAAARREIDRYILLIKQKVTRNWLRPIGVKKGLSCTVRLRLIPGGEVVGVQIVRSSGNAIFDRSAETAVRKSSPLPVPDDPAIMDRMREIDFVFIPEE